MNIVLTGFMASGKTSIGEAIADISKYKFTDTDAAIVLKAGMDINEIFARYGEEHFRWLEKEAVREAALLQSAVIATGGGVVLDSENIDILRKTGVIFNLDPDFSVIAERVEKAMPTRPLMKNESLDDIKKRFDERKPYYDNCDHKIHVMSGREPHSYAMEILKIMEEI